MCGIFGYFIKNNSDLDHCKVFNSFLLSQGRGPDDTYFKYQKNKYFLGFHRLSINDVSTKGNQPFKFVCEDGSVYTVICNGEIYNSNELKKEFPNYNFTSSSDCEVLIPMFMKYYLDFPKYLKGVFAFIIILEKSDNNIEVIVGRDRFGVRPLYFGKYFNGNIMFSSEFKSIKDICSSCSQVEPGTITKYDFNTTKSNLDNVFKTKYYDIINNIPELNSSWQVMEYCCLINKTFTQAVIKRIENTDRPVCAFLSGGLDSSLVCAIASKYFKEFRNEKLHTFAIGFKGATDLDYAKSVAEFIDSEHHEVIIDEDSAIKSIKDVIWAIESYDITTVRASVGQYLISKHISENTDFKVILSGDGSDEVAGGYLESYLAPNEKEFESNIFKRIENIHKYDVQRADRATSIHGLELRVPFLDHEFVENYLSIPSIYRRPIKGIQMEKKLLRDSFQEYLPNDVLYRQKEAFSDGISSTDNSWHNIIKKACDKIFSETELEEKLALYENCIGAKPFCKESLYYRVIFENLYSNKYTYLLSEYWMQRWSNTNDPSARSLSVYN